MCVFAEQGAVAGVGPPRLAIDRVFAARGRGIVVTGSLRGAGVAPGDVLRLLPDGLDVRVREVQERGVTVAVAGGGRTALLVGGLEHGVLRRGQVLTIDPAVVATSRVLVAMRPPAGLGGRTASGVSAPGDRDRLRLHLGTAQVGALVVRGAREAIDLPDGSQLAILRLDAPIAAAAGDRFALRRPSPGVAAGGGTIVDAMPPRGVSRRRLTTERAAALASSIGGAGARLDLHGAVRSGSRWDLAADVAAALEARAMAAVSDHHAGEPGSPGISAAILRQSLATPVRRLVTIGRSGADEVARRVVEDLVDGGTLARDGEWIRDPTRTAGLPPATLAAMDRLEAALSVAAPPQLAVAARAAACPPDGVRALEASGRIVRLEDDLAWAAGTYRGVSRQAAGNGGASRRPRPRGLPRCDRHQPPVRPGDPGGPGPAGAAARTDAGQILGPRTIARMEARAAAADGAEAPGLGADAPRPDRPRWCTSSRFASNKLAASLPGVGCSTTRSRWWRPSRTSRWS